MGSFGEVLILFGLYAALHSVLLTDGAQLGLQALVGPRAFHAWFRFCYCALAVTLFVGFVLWVGRLPDAELYRIDGSPAWALWGVRLVALWGLVRCLRTLGVGEFLGLHAVLAWLRGETAHSAQTDGGDLMVRGPYRWVRHPMYGAGLVLLWAEPHGTWNGLAFAIAASAYLVLGSFHEERRLLRQFGQAYRRYAHGTPRFLPWKVPR